MLKDMDALIKSLVVNLAITAIWYAAEFEQFGTLQWDRWGDNLIGVIYLFALWWAFHKHNNLLQEIIKICRKDNESKKDESNERCGGTV